MFLATVAVGLGVIGAISLAPLYASRLRVRHSSHLGSTLVLAAIGVTFCCAGAPGAFPLQPVLAILAFPLLLGGALLLLNQGPDDGHDWSGDDEPPWWPEFEREFRRYSRRPRQPAGRF